MYKLAVTFLVALLFVAVGCVSDPPAHPHTARQGMTPPQEIQPVRLPPIGVRVIEYKGRPGHNDDAENHQVEQALNKPVSFTAGTTTLDAVIAFLRKQTGVNIAMNTLTLDLVEIDSKADINLNLKNVPARQLLALALEQASSNTYDDDKADYQVISGVVMVSTIREIKSYVQTRAYDLTWYFEQHGTFEFQLYQNHPRALELLALVRNEPSIAVLTPADLAEHIKQLDDWCATGKRLIIEEMPSKQERLEQLQELMYNTIGEPDEWLDAESTLYETNGEIYVKTSRQNHAEILQLLTALRDQEVQRFERQSKRLEVFLLLEKAEAYRLKQDYTRALLLIDQALRVDPESMEAQLLRNIVVHAQS